MRLVQLIDESGQRCIASSGETPARRVADFERIYDLALAAIAAGSGLEPFVKAHLSTREVDLDAAEREGRLLAPVDHPDPAHCVVTLTGLTHLGSAASRDKMHASLDAGTATDTMRMFHIGMEGGRPAEGQIGAQPEWAYKGDGACIVPPGSPLEQPPYAEDGGEEAEIAGIYVISDDGSPWRIGRAIGNEFADHALEKRNYLYLAHSKLRQCSLGPELLLGPLPESVTGTVNILRSGDRVWTSKFESGEAHMCHSIANLEHHHFKYALFRRPGDVHIHFMGANGVSFGQGFQTQEGDLFEIDVPLFGRPLRNSLHIAPNPQLVKVNSL